MKHWSVRLASIVALLGMGVLTNVSIEKGVDPAGADLDAVSVTFLHDIGSPLPACAAAGGGFPIEGTGGRLGRPSAFGTFRAPTLHAGWRRASRNSGDSRFFDGAARLTRGGIDTSALGTPPPHV